MSLASERITFCVNPVQEKIEETRLYLNQSVQLISSWISSFTLLGRSWSTMGTRSLLSPSLGGVAQCRLLSTQQASHKEGSDVTVQSSSILTCWPWIALCLYRFILVLICLFQVYASRKGPLHTLCMKAFSKSSWTAVLSNRLLKSPVFTDKLGDAHTQE